MFLNCNCITSANFFLPYSTIEFSSCKLYGYTATVIFLYQCWWTCAIEYVVTFLCFSCNLRNRNKDSISFVDSAISMTNYLLHWCAQDRTQGNSTGYRNWCDLMVVIGFTTTTFLFINLVITKSDLKHISAINLLIIIWCWNTAPNIEQLLQISSAPTHAINFKVTTSDIIYLSANQRVTSSKAQLSQASVIKLGKKGLCADWNLL